jgi:hypothetical protein
MVGRNRPRDERHSGREIGTSRFRPVSREGAARQFVVDLRSRILCNQIPRAAKRPAERAELSRGIQSLAENSPNKPAQLRIRYASSIAPPRSRSFVCPAFIVKRPSEDAEGADRLRPFVPPMALTAKM